jgi:hypothetical protein
MRGRVKSWYRFAGLADCSPQRKQGMLTHRKCPCLRCGLQTTCEKLNPLINMEQFWQYARFMQPAYQLEHADQN